MLLEAAAEHKLVSHLVFNFFKNSTLTAAVKGTVFAKNTLSAFAAAR